MAILIEIRSWLALLLIFASMSCSARLIDAEISENVETLIAINYCTKDLNIEVTTRNGVVSLVGVTHTNAKAYKLIEITASTTGVKDIDTQDLTIDYGKPICPDTIIAAKVKGRLIQQEMAAYCDDYCWPQTHIHVYAVHGHVYLDGVVPCHRQEVYSSRLARHVRGVRTVTSRLVVKERFKRSYVARRINCRNVHKSKL